MLATFRGNWTQPTQMDARVVTQLYFDGTQGDPGYIDDGSDPGFELLPPDALPDFSDPATVGCLLFLTRETTADPAAFVRPVSADGPWLARWRSRRDRALLSEIGASEVEALVLMLEKSHG